jgi:hypothetical protein
MVCTRTRWSAFCPNGTWSRPWPATGSRAGPPGVRLYDPEVIFAARKRSVAIRWADDRPAIRHPAVLRDGRLAGVISIGDVVKCQIAEATRKRNPRTYIAADTGRARRPRPATGIREKVRETVGPVADKTTAAYIAASLGNGPAAGARRRKPPGSSGSKSRKGLLP